MTPLTFSQSSPHCQNLQAQVDQVLNLLQQEQNLRVQIDIPIRNHLQNWFVAA